MNVWLPLALAVLACAVSWWLTGRVRRYALARRMLDVPNERSSHAVATPRGGGIAIVIATLLTVVMAAAMGVTSWRWAVAIFGGGVVVAVVGFMDDHRHLRRRWRLLGHFTAAAWVLAVTGGLPELRVLGVTMVAGLPAQMIAAVGLVWLLNLTNFMDGIDGIAAIEVISVALGGVLLYAVSDGSARDWSLPLILAASTFGFLVWNWPPAKIFMGDAGSGFVGLLLGVLTLQAGSRSPDLLWSWVILLGVFVVDASVTLARRAARRERIYEAHRSHAYQHAARQRSSHKTVTMAVAIINVVWLLPLAWLVARHLLDGATGIVVAYTPLVAAAVALGAGTPHATTPIQSTTGHV
jgi:Fuc2NAc and GlcNAc transferase